MAVLQLILHVCACCSAALHVCLHCLPTMLSCFTAACMPSAIKLHTTTPPHPPTLSALPGFLQSPYLQDLLLLLRLPWPVHGSGAMDGTSLHVCVCVLQCCSSCVVMLPSCHCASPCLPVCLLHALSSCPSSLHACLFHDIILTCCLHPLLLPCLLCVPALPSSRALMLHCCLHAFSH